MVTKPKLKLADRNMLKLIDTLKELGMIKNRQEFVDNIGMQKQVITSIKAGLQSFRIEHIAKACETYSVNANWVLGLEEKMFRSRVTKLKTSGDSQKEIYNKPDL